MTKTEDSPKFENAKNSENECILEEELESIVLIHLAKGAIQENAKLYGPVYTHMASEYALKFESRMLKEDPPRNIQGLEDVTNYIIKNQSRYPRGHCALIYGLSRTESELQGFAGTSGSRRSAHNAMKNFLEATGLLKSLVGTTEDALEANKLFSVRSKDTPVDKRLPTRKTEQTQRIHYIRVEGKNKLIVIISNCVYKDACRAFLDEGISRMLGGLVCINLITGAAFAEIITRKTFDYVLEEFDEPDCRGRIWKV